MGAELPDPTGQWQDDLDDARARASDLRSAFLEQVEHGLVVGSDDRVEGDEAVVMRGDDQGVEKRPAQPAVVPRVVDRQGDVGSVGARIPGVPSHRCGRGHPVTVEL